MSAKEQSINANTLILIKLHFEHHRQSCLPLFKEDERTPEESGG